MGLAPFESCHRRRYLADHLVAACPPVGAHHRFMVLLPIGEVWWRTGTERLYQLREPVLQRPQVGPPRFDESRALSTTP